MENIAPLVPGGTVTDYRTFLGDHELFYVVNARTEADWLLPQLLEDNATVAHLAVSGNNVLLEVRP